MQKKQHKQTKQKPLQANRLTFINTLLSVFFDNSHNTKRNISAPLRYGKGRADFGAYGSTHRERKILFRQTQVLNH